MRPIRIWPGLLLVLELALPCLRADDLESEARAILQRRCLPCHGPKTKTSGLDLSGRESALGGGSKGPALKPCAPGESLLLERVLKNQMPPTGPLPESEKESLRHWIEAGAPLEGVIEERRAGLDWWSLQPLKVRDAPITPGIPAAWSRSVIDRWVYAKLGGNGLAPSPRAGRRTLIRLLVQTRTRSTTPPTYISASPSCPGTVG